MHITPCAIRAAYGGISRAHRQPELNSIDTHEFHREHLGQGLHAGHRGTGAWAIVCALVSAGLAGIIPRTSAEFDLREVSFMTPRAAEWRTNPSRLMRYMACLNPHSLVHAKSDAAFGAELHDPNLRMPDGAGALLAPKLIGGRLC